MSAPTHLDAQGGENLGKISHEVIPAPASNGSPVGCWTCSCGTQLALNQVECPNCGKEREPLDIAAREYLCCACGEEKRGEPQHVCADCLQKAVEFIRFRDDQVGANDDVRRINELEGALRYAIALQILTRPNVPVRKIIDDVAEGKPIV